MNRLREKNILLIVTGSIAAYKSAYLTRLLVKEGGNVQILMTPAAKEFITPLTMSTLSKNKVLIEMMDEGSWNSHVDLGLWADLVLVAPATANTLSKMAIGIADNLALTAYLSAKCPVMIAPAMDLDMFSHPTTNRNIEQLESIGNFIIPVGEGELASGLSGEGRMAEPEIILDHVISFFSKKKTKLTGKTVLITAGPTYEAIDPVRFIGNHSSGKMGVALAEACIHRGGIVKLVLGPSKLKTQKAIEIHRVQSAAEMAKESLKLKDEADVIILAAAVADYTPLERSVTKIKKSDGDLSLKLKRTLDIAKEIGKQKRKDQLVIGFALETHNAFENAQNKRIRKNFDFIVLNSLANEGAGFKHDTNKISIIGPDNKIKEFELKSKAEVAEDILNEIENLL